MAAVEAPIRLVAPADPLTVCVQPTMPGRHERTTCSATINPEALPRSWRGYGAADDVVWPSGKQTDR